MTAPFPRKPAPQPRTGASLATLALRFRELLDDMETVQAAREKAAESGWKSALSEELDALVHEQFALIAAAAAVRAPHPEGIAAKLALLEALAAAQPQEIGALAGSPYDLFASLQQDLAALSRAMG